MSGLSCIMPMFERLNELIKFSQSRECFVCDFFAIVKLCQVDLYCWYNDPYNAYLNDVFHGYWNLLNETFNVVVHEWALDLNKRLENLSFHIVGIFVMMQCYCFWNNIICACDLCFFLTLANLSLGGTTRNVTPQISMTHPTSRQHRTHIKKKIHSKLCIKRLPKSRKIQNSN